MPNKTILTPSHTQKSEQATRTALERLVEAGLVDAHVTGRGCTYTLSAKVYRHSGREAAYIRQTGFDPIHQEQMVLSYIDKHGSIFLSPLPLDCGDIAPTIGKNEMQRFI